MVDVSALDFMKLGLLNDAQQKQLRGRSLLGLGQGLLKAAGPQRVAPSLGQALGSGLESMQTARSSYMDELYKSALMKKSLDTFSYKERKVPYVTDEGEQREKLEVSNQGGRPGTWVEKSDYLKFKKSEPTGGLNTSQIKTNNEIDNARGQLNEAFVKWQNEKPEERKDKILGDWVYETSVKLDEMTRLPVPDYNTFAMKAANKAMQSKYGDDLEFSEIYTSIFEGSPQATSLWDATQKTPDKNEDSIWSKVGKFLTGDDQEEVKTEVKFTITDDKYKSMSVKEIIELSKTTNPNWKEEKIVEELIKRKIIQRK